MNALAEVTTSLMGANLHGRDGPVTRPAARGTSCTCARSGRMEAPSSAGGARRIVDAPPRAALRGRVARDARPPPIGLRLPGRSLARHAALDLAAAARRRVR